MFIRQELTDEQVQAFYKHLEAINDLATSLTDHNAICSYAEKIGYDRMVQLTDSKIRLNELTQAWRDIK
jgi:hypothetical protein